jgi:hypothetical protein
MTSKDWKSGDEVVRVDGLDRPTKTTYQGRDDGGVYIWQHLQLSEGFLFYVSNDHFRRHWAHVPEPSDSEPQESEQAETKQKDKAGEDV